jgi:hypothetical protein
MWKCRYPEMAGGWARINHTLIGKMVRITERRTKLNDGLGSWSGIGLKGIASVSSSFGRWLLNDWWTKKWTKKDIFYWQKLIITTLPCLPDDKIIWKHCFSLQMALWVFRDLDVERCHAYQLFCSDFWFRPHYSQKKTVNQERWRWLINDFSVTGIFVSSHRERAFLLNNDG